VGHLAEPWRIVTNRSSALSIVEASATHDGERGTEEQRKSKQRPPPYMKPTSLRLHRFSCISIISTHDYR
jgi:hypothetical protein